MITFGSDPEFMLELNGKIRSAIGVLKGDKEHKTKVGPFEFYYDNVLAECTIPPTTNVNDTVSSIRDCFTSLFQIVKPYKPIICASHVYHPEEFFHEDAFKVYCVAENCCYIMKEIEQDEQIFTKTDLRSAGGHIHIGNTEIKKKYNSFTTARLMDLFLGIPSIFLDNNPASQKRKEIYGKSGRFRNTDYGIEYRSLSNFWLKSPKLVSFVFRATETVVNLVESGKWQDFWSIDEVKLNDRESWKDRKFDPASCHKAVYDVNKLQQAINTSNKDLALEFTNLFPKPMFKEVMELASLNFESLEKEWQI